MFETSVEDRLFREARELFAQTGYHGTSVRTITNQARANLGAVTYYFGSKRGLYEAVLAAEIAPLRTAIAEAARESRPPLERLEHIVRIFFAHLREHPSIPRLLVQQLATSSDMTETALNTMAANHGAIASVIAEGQREGSIRSGDPRLMALSIGSQPMMLSLMHEVTSRVVDVDQPNPPAPTNLVDSVVEFVLAALATPSS